MRRQLSRLGLDKNLVAILDGKLRAGRLFQLFGARAESRRAAHPVGGESPGDRAEPHADLSTHRSGRDRLLVRVRG